MRKRDCALLLLVSVCVAIAPAQAVRMPQGTGAALADEGWYDFKAGALAVIAPQPFDQDAKGEPTHTAALMTRKQRNMLFVFQYDPQQRVYVLDAAAEKAVYQNDRMPAIAYDVETQRLTYTYEARKPASGRPKRETYAFGRDDHGTWKFLSAGIVYQPDGGKGALVPWYTATMEGGALRLALDWRSGVEADSPLISSEEVRVMPREAWLYDLHHFDLAQLHADIAFLSSNTGEAAPPAVAMAPAEPTATAATAVAATAAVTPAPAATQSNPLDELSVDLASWGLTDITHLAGLRVTQKLDLSHNELTDIGPLAGLTGLRWLNLSYNQIENVDALVYLRQLETLRLGGNPLADVQPLAACVVLKELTLSNGVTDLSPLAGLRRLTSLTVTGSPLADLSPLAHGPPLTALALDRNQIADIAPLRDMDSLVWLSLQHNRIADLGPMAKLKSLRHLDVSGNLVADVTPLRDLKKLTRLNLADNQVADLTPLKDVRSLIYLDLTGNRVTDLTALKWLPNLQELYLEGNPPGMDLMPLYGLKKLQLIHLPHGIPEEHAVALARRLPKCAVVWGDGK